MRQLRGFAPAPLARVKPRPVSLSRSPFPPRSRAMGRVRSSRPRLEVPAYAGIALPPIMGVSVERWPLRECDGVDSSVHRWSRMPGRRKSRRVRDGSLERKEGAATNSQSAEADACALQPTIGIAAPVPLPFDGRVGPIRKAAAHSRAQRKRKRSPRRKPRPVFCSEGDDTSYSRL